MNKEEVYTLTILQHFLNRLFYI